MMAEKTNASCDNCNLFINQLCRFKKAEPCILWKPALFAELIPTAETKVIGHCPHCGKKIAVEN